MTPDPVHDPSTELIRLRAENHDLRVRLQQSEDQSDADLVAAGFYTYQHPLEDSTAYSEHLAKLRGELKEMIRNKAAIETSPGFIYDNSLAKGKKMTSDLAQLMLRAYNAEAENCVRYVKAGNLRAAITRLEKSAAAVARLGAMMDMRVSPGYHDLRVEELTLTAEFLMKKQEERDAAREERVRLREEALAQKELEAERERLDKQRRHYVNVLAALDTSDPNRQDIEAKLADVDAAIERNDYRIANIRAGYVYVISNLGAFGPGIVKIGLTRRLEPMDRVRELGDASVPFWFDVHALFFSEDAVTVEAELHRRFADRRVNRINLRREFFYATPLEVKDQLAEIAGHLIEFTAEPEAEQYRLSVSMGASSATRA
ncbi:DUF4041 domain-containing protein [Nocardia violaceofusca]|uniref:DUF4041 domain-containing protein n=1 Tax=Nocardia violaceofusca TaxID=941182 RepID=UPI000A074184|nr:DUF4041 domain-containing protein [Nocardia violaceofusca]